MDLGNVAQTPARVPAVVPTTEEDLVGLIARAVATAMVPVDAQLKMLQTEMIAMKKCGGIMAPMEWATFGMWTSCQYLPALFESLRMDWDSFTHMGCWLSRFVYDEFPVQQCNIVLLRQERDHVAKSGLSTSVIHRTDRFLLHAGLVKDGTATSE